MALESQSCCTCHVPCSNLVIYFATSSGVKKKNIITLDLFSPDELTCIFAVPGRNPFSIWRYLECGCSTD